MTKPRKKPTDKEHVPVLYLRISEELERALQAFIASQRVPPERTTVGIQALTEFLKREGFPPKSA